MDCKMTFFLLARALPAWLALSRAERNRITEEEIAPLVNEWGIEMRFFDCEAFTGRCSDILMLQAPDILKYQFFIDGLRDTSFFTRPWFELVDILPGIEDAYRRYEESLQPA